ncbi:hypothetical protein [Flavobacterium hercynium]|uniref:DUF4595 domain-containing protein n=1 Tax=Flavobacterium hercynium TaxID=387094 RepID=A0A226HI71_9FLAO|nr:hypothetical protein [Flavobacterium hercynium]OXA93977.1 hypothetical protein B0A66_05610 [Flavobacterium hercynium]SMP36620.1 hypothetical protein SAMN06265346_12317 [Flavobacterium hercynium]
MKRILCILSVAFLALTSCSKDDNLAKREDTSKPAPVLVKRETYTIGSRMTNSLISYEGNKIISTTSSSGRVSKFTYTEDYITKRESYNMAGKLESTTDYVYDKGKLVEKIRKDGEDSEYYYKTKYIHNGSGIIIYQEFRVTIANGEEQASDFAGKYTYKSSNLVKIESTFNGVDAITTLEYDSNNTPYRNIKGFNLLLGDDSSNFNNIIKKSYVLKEADSEPRLTTYEYKYNTKNYPTEMVINYYFENSVSTEITQFSY